MTVSTGIITTIAGSSTSGGYSGDNGQATSAKLNNPMGVSVDSSGLSHYSQLYSYYYLLAPLGNLYIADYSNHRIRKLTVSTGIITTVAGTGTGSYSGDGGAATSATLSTPFGVLVDTSGNKNLPSKSSIVANILTFYLIRYRLHRRFWQQSDPQGVHGEYRNTHCSTQLHSQVRSNQHLQYDACISLSNIPCSASPTFIPSTAAPSVQPTYSPLLSPHSISVISTIVGTGSAGYSGDNGQATSAAVNYPHGIVIDTSGNVFFNDFYNHRVRKIAASTGIITTYAGTGTASYSGENGVATSASLNLPNGLGIDSTGINTQYFEGNQY